MRKIYISIATFVMTLLVSCGYKTEAVAIPNDTIKEEAKKDSLILVKPTNGCGLNNPMNPKHISHTSHASHSSHFSQHH